MVTDFTTITFSKPVLVPVTKTCPIFSSGQSPGLTEEKGEFQKYLYLDCVTVWYPKHRASLLAGRHRRLCKISPVLSELQARWQLPWEALALSKLVRTWRISPCCWVCSFPLRRLQVKCQQKLRRKKKWIRSSGGTPPTRTTHLGVFRSL